MKLLCIRNFPLPHPECIAPLSAFPPQVLYQTVSDPQQRIAKLTGKDPRRRRTSSGGGGSSLPKGDLRSGDEDKSGQRRTSFPGSVSSQRFGWRPTTPSRPADKTSDLANDSTKAWGSPIVAPADASMGGDVDKALEEARHTAVGAGVGLSDDETGKATSKHEGSESAVDASAVPGVVALKPSVSVGGPEGAAFADEPEMKLYSESESEGGEDGDGDAENETGEKGEEYNGGGGSDGGDRGGGGDSGHGGGGDAGAHEGGVSMAPLDDSENGAESTALGDQRPDSWLQSPETGTSPNWAGTSSSDDPESPGSARTESAAYETAVDISTVNQVDDAATVPTYPPASGRGGAAPEALGALVRESSETFFRGPSHSSIPGSTVMRIGEGDSGKNVGNDVAGLTVVRAGKGVDSAGKPNVSVGGSTAGSTGGIPDAGRHSETIAAESSRARREEEPDPTVRTGRVDATITSSAPSRRITWATDETQERGGVRRDEEGKAEEGNAGCVSHRPAERTEGLKHADDQAEERLPVDPGSNSKQYAHEGGDSLLREILHSSVESGGGAAALAASGVFDVTGTSAELEESRESGVSVGDVDSLEEVGVQGRTWVQQHPVRDEEGRRAVEGRSSESLSTGNTRGLIEDLMRQVCQPNTSKVTLVR